MRGRKERKGEVIKGHREREVNMWYIISGIQQDKNYRFFGYC